MIYVIGSGPAGVSCAAALLKRRLPVTIIDAGVELDPHVHEVIRHLSTKERKDWDEKSLKLLRQNFLPGMDGRPVKQAYGSDFPYRETDQHLRLRSINVDILPSFARGGLSNAWGGAVLPYSAHDIEDWPISREEFAPHYEAVFSFMDLAAVEDDLKVSYPLFAKAYAPLTPSRQAVSFMNDVKRSRAVLRRAGFRIGYSRLAVRVSSMGDRPGCVYCGMCLHGCPYELIYSARTTLERLKTHPGLHYVKDVIVDKLIEGRNGVEILGHARLGGEPVSFSGSRVFLAAGVIPTTKIVLDSLGAYDRPVLLADSQYFLFPLFRFRNVKNVVHEDLYTLAQIFLELRDAWISKHTIHLQAYTYNDFYLSKFKKIAGPMFPLIQKPLEHALGRLIVVQGFLHSDLSSKISVTLKRDRTSSRCYVALEAQTNPESKRVINSVMKKFLRHAWRFHSIPIVPQLQIGRAGKGFHSGGTFPMRKNPTSFESDTLGRPFGFKNVHLVDASTFPTIPATTITLNVMANAHRIASSDEVV